MVQHHGRGVDPWVKALGAILLILLGVCIMAFGYADNVLGLVDWILGEGLGFRYGQHAV